VSRKHINPRYHKAPSKSFTAEEAIAGLGSDTQILSQLISKAESNLPEDRQLIIKVILGLDNNKSCRRIAVTGAPGVGKSSFLNSYCNYLAQQGKMVAILPVDPSSYKSKGSILGDKTRMDNLVGNEKVFVKPMASALELGGVAPATAVAIALCERAGFDYVFVETVGVGQSEYVVRNLVDLFLLLLQPGGGDDLQGIKRGIMEMADLILITKADGELLQVAKESRIQYTNALKFMMHNKYGWKVKLALYSIEEMKYNEVVSQMISDYYETMPTNLLVTMRNEQELENYKVSLRNLFYHHMLKRVDLKERVGSYAEQISAGKLLSLEAISKLETEIRGRDV